MIHRLNALSLSEKLHESMQDSGEDLRFAAIEANLAEYADKCATWHWHEFVEFACVLEGEQECCTPGGVTRLRPGDGYFVNASVLHLNRIACGFSSPSYFCKAFHDLTGLSPRDFRRANRVPAR